MRVNLKNKEFYINFPNTLFSDLTEYNMLDKKLDLDLAAYILYSITKQQSEPHEWVSLSSKILRRYDHGEHKSNEQIRILEEGGFIEYLNHQYNIKGKKNSCRKFRICLKYYETTNQEKIEKSIIAHEITNRPLLEKIKKHNQQRRIEASSSVNHLTRWLDKDGFTIEAQKALEYVEDKHGNNVKEPFKYLKRLASINSFDPAHSYSRNGKGDRFDSCFTRFAKDLKQFVRYESQRLVEVDIKSSQPLMFAILLERFLDHYNELSTLGYGVTEKRLYHRVFKTIKDYINNDTKDYYNNNKYTIDIEQISYNITIILLKVLKNPDFTQIRNFISLVKDGQVYESLGDFLFSKEAIWARDGKCYTKLWDEKEKQKETSFDTVRDCSKIVLLNALYSREGKGSIKVLNKAKEHFSIVFKIAEAFKTIDYRDFSLILQRMEAKCVLDFCSKNIATKYPDMPLICRHDSLSTLEKHGNLLMDEFQEQIDTYFNTSIKLDMKIW